MRVDKITRDYLIEIKKSDADIEASKISVILLFEDIKE